MKMLAEWFWTDRWMGSSGFGLPLEARGLYREMLTQAWHRGARLPKDESTIRRFCGVEREEWDRSWPMVRKFWREDGDSLVNDTQLEVYAEASARRDRAQARAQAGAQARHRHVLKHEQKPQQKPCPPSPSPSLTTTTDISPSPIRETTDGGDDGAKAELVAALVAYRDRNCLAGTNQDVLDLPAFHAPTGPVRLATCTNPALMRATAGKLRKAITPRKAKAAKDSTDWAAAEASEVRDVEAWIRANWGNRDTAAPETEAELRADLAALNPPLHLAQAIEAALFERYPAANADFAARVDRMRAPAETGLRATA